MRNSGSYFPVNEADLLVLQGESGQVENSEVREGGHVPTSRYDVTQNQVHGSPGEMEVRDMIRWTIGSNFCAPLPESTLTVELYLREKVSLAPVDPCTRYQRAGSQGSYPQHRLGFLCDFVDDDVVDLLREGCSHEEAVFDACPTVSSDPPTLRTEFGREVSLSGLCDRK